MRTAPRQTRRLALLVALLFAVLATFASAHAAVHATEAGASHQCEVCHLARVVPVVPAPAVVPAPDGVTGTEPVPVGLAPVSQPAPAPHGPRAPPSALA